MEAIRVAGGSDTMRPVELDSADGTLLDRLPPI